MLGGLVHGVPQVALPRGTDQPENAALLVRAGAVAAERVRDEIAGMPDAETAWAP
jgi:UDP:flavonoid glycosyltransferase YjiC (YdhE family)